jgi:protoporphyrinogen oxidase
MKSIAILGGGITGLTAAYRLSKKGYKVTIFEKSNNLGGLASGFEISGNNLEKAYHHLFKTDLDIINLTKELGLEDKLQWHNSSVSIYRNSKLYPFITPIDLIKFTPLNFFNRIRAGLVVLYLQKTKNWKALKGSTAAEWMRKMCGKQVYEVIWEPLLKGKFDKYYNKISMAWLWARIHIRANSKQKGDSKEKLGYYKGGFRVLVDKLKEVLLESGVSIITESTVESVSEKGKKVEVKADGKALNFDAVLSTLPSTVFSKVVESSNKKFKDYVTKLDSINYLGAVLNVFSSEQSLSKYYWHNINDTSFPFLVFIQHTNLIPKEEYGGNHLYYIGAYVPHDHKYFSIGDEELKTLWYGYLKKIFPHFDESKIIENNIFKFKHAQHIVDTEYENKIPEYKTPIRGVYLSNFSQIYPEDRGTNYAVREGNKIADIINTDLQ